MYRSGHVGQCDLIRSNRWIHLLRRTRLVTQARLGRNKCDKAISTYQNLEDGLKESIVVPDLRHVPDHGTAEAVELLAPLKDGSKLLSADVSRARGAGVTRSADEDLDVGVGAGLRPVVPLLEVVVGLLLGAGLEGRDAAEVVVELNHDEVEGYVAVQHLSHGRVGVRALRGRRQVVLLARVGRHVLPEALGERQQVAGRRLEVEVEAVDHRLTEGPVLLGRVGAEQVPDGVSTLLGRRLVREPGLGVGRATQGEQDGLLVFVLAGLNVLPV